MFIEEFKEWFEQNIDKFICKPYIYKNRIKNKRKKYLEIRFENIIPEIYLYVNEDDISVFVDLKKIIGYEINDLLGDSYVYLKQNKEGKYYNDAHPEPKFYNTLKEVYQEEFNECFLSLINKIIKEENFLAVSWNGGIVSARIINPKTQPDVYESYKFSSGKIGSPPTNYEALISNLVNINNKKMISSEREKNWNSTILSISDRK